MAERALGTGSSEDLDRLAAAERGAQAAGRALARWWRELRRADGEDATSSSSLDALFTDALPAIKSAIGSDSVALLLTDDSGKELVARAALGLSESVTLGLNIKIGEGISGRVIADRRPLIVDDMSKAEVANPVLRRSGLGSIVAVPILVDDHVLGVLHAGSYKTGHFVAKDRQIMELMALRIANGLEQVALFERERAARMRAEELADRLTRMQQITSLLASSTDAGSTARVLAESLAFELPGTSRWWCGVWLVRDGVLELVGDDPHPQGPAICSVDLLGDSVLAAAARAKRTLYRSDAEIAKEPFRSVASFPEGVSNLAIVPVVVGAESVGVVAIAREGKSRFTEDENEFFSAVAGQAAQAFDRARLYTQQAQIAEVTAYFSKTAKAMAQASSLTETLERLGVLALEVLGDICLIDVLDEPGRLLRVVALHRDPGRQHLVNRLRAEPPDLPSEHPSAQVILSGRTTWGGHLSEDFLRSTTHGESHFQLAKLLGFRSYLAVPLAAQGETIGSMLLVSTTRQFTMDEVRFAEALAEHVAAVVDSAREYDVTRKTSRILQDHLLPSHLPEIAGLDIQTLYLPATRGLEIGGDFYDALSSDDGSAWFVVGDVAGHDSAAAAIMGQLRSAARAMLGTVDGPGELVDALHEGWDRLSLERMATGVFGRLDPTSGAMQLASAGHYPPLIIEPGGTHFVEVKPSSPLGAPALGALEWKGLLTAEQLLLLYTDGAIDERTVGSEASMKRLAAAASDGPLDPFSVCNRIVDRLEVDGSDDVAMMAIRRSGPRSVDTHEQV